MTQPLFLFRPEPGWSESAERAAANGLAVLGHPLSRVEPVGWDAPDLGEYDALLVGSANVFRHGGEQLDKFKTVPIFAVGEATARCARDAGFAVERTGGGGLQGLIDGIGGKRLSLLRLCGETRVALDLPASIRMDERVVYRSVPLELDEQARTALAAGGVVALHSGDAAARFAQECGRWGIARGGLSLLLIGPRLEQAVGRGWRSIHVAEVPSEGALLELAGIVCKD